MSEIKKLTTEEIKQKVDEISIKTRNEVFKLSKDLFPDNQRSAWIFRGRVFQSLFANHFIPVNYQAESELNKDAK